MVVNTREKMTDDSPVVWGRLILRGPDAVTFLDGQWTQRVPERVGERVPGALLQPDGVVVCAPWAQRLEPEVIALDVPEESSSVMEARLRRFRVRVRVDFEWGAVEEKEFATRGEQIELGVPGASEFALGYVAQSFGTRFVSERISFTKGCFTGQELVGRLDARGGSAPFRLARLTTDSLERLETIEEAWTSEAQRRSRLTSVVVGAHQVRALALLHRSAEISGEGWAGEWL
jgi:folate-binding Fe-S cluster repair protein YgfZ